LESLVVYTVKHNTSNIVMNTLHRRHVSAYTVAIFRTYVFNGIHLLNLK
jgi:hypothetical protein